MDVSTVRRKSTSTIASFLLATTLLGVTAISSRAQSDAQVRPLPAVDAVGAKKFALSLPIRLSPDAKWVTYSVIDPRRQPIYGALGNDYAIITPTGVVMTVATSDVWVSSLETGEARNITRGAGASWGGAWSPDGRSLAFYSDRDGAIRIWMWDAVTGRVRRLSEVVARPFFEFEQILWHPSGKQLLAKVLPEGVSLEQVLDRVRPELSAAVGTATPNVRVYRSAVAGRDSTETALQYSAYSGDLALIDVKSGAVRRMVHNIKTNGYWLSPQGTAIAYTERVNNHSSVQQIFNLGVVSLDDGKPRILASDIPQPYGLSVSWSPDGSQLAYTNAIGTSAVAGSHPRGDCFVVAVTGGPSRNVTPGSHPPLARAFDAPAWDATGKWLYLLGGDTLWRASAAGDPLGMVATLQGHTMLQIVGRVGAGTLWTHGDGKAIYLRVQETATRKAGIAQVDLVSGSTSLVVEEDRNYLNSVHGMDVVGNTLIRMAEGAQVPEELWVARGPDSVAHPRRLTHLNPKLDGYTYGASRLVEWRTDDGVVVHGVIVLPAGYVEGRKYPLVVRVYGGDYPSRELFWFGGYGVGQDLRQLFATRGYAVLIPDMPLNVGTPMADVEKVILPGVNKLIDLGIADPDRLGVMGSSYGGYTTLALVTQTHRFKAAVSMAGFSNLISKYGMLLRGGAAGTSNIELGQQRMGVSPWDNLTRYIDNSPFYQFDRVETPILLIHGDADIAVEPARGDESFVALRRLGKTVEYAKYAGEGHGWWGFTDSVDGVERTIGWFDKYLVSAPTTSRR
ncbi:MAG: hypothetical protein JWL61_659 [Gemmatimonadetes bacterium]|nr:hypothetical protein [Gemmatimonadota bacterium]